MNAANPDLHRFLEHLRANPALQARLEKAGDVNSFVDDAVRLGAENGYSFTAEAFKAALAPQGGGPKGELSEADLERVSGGFLGGILKGILGG